MTTLAIPPHANVIPQIPSCNKPGLRGRHQRRWGYSLVTWLLYSCLITSVQAHLLDTTKVRLNDLNATATFSLVDSNGCSALITATSGDTNIATVTPTGPIDAVKQTFTVTARTAQKADTTITIKYIGEDVGTDGPCQDTETEVIEVCVRPRQFTSGETTAKAIVPEDPVDSSTGEFLRPEPSDIDLGGKLRLYLQRYYASTLERDGYSIGQLGNNWRHNFNWSLRSFGNQIEIVTPTGEVVVFADSDTGLDQGDWILQHDTEIPYQLIGQIFGAEYTFYDPQTRLYYIFNNLFTIDVDTPLSRIEDGKGNMLTLTQGLMGVASITDGLGRTLTLNYTNSQLTSVSDGTRTVSYAYTDNNLTRVTDPLGHIWQYTYETGHAVPGLLTGAIAPLGNARVSVTWDAQGRVATLTDGAGHTTTLNVGADSTTATQPIGRPIEHSFNSEGRLDTVTDESGFNYRFMYDADGRRDQFTNGNGDVAQVDHDPMSGLPTRFTDVDDQTTSLTYTTRLHPSGITRYDVTRIEHPDGTTELFAYDSNGNITSSTNRVGDVYLATYNNRSDVLTVTLPTGAVYAATYNANGTLASFTDPAGDTQTYSYDALRRRTRVTYADNSSRQFEYDARNRITAYVDREGRITTFVYDANGNIATTTTPLGEATSFSYDGLDRVIGAIAPNGAEMGRAYDALGRIVTQTDLNGHTSTIERDGRGAAIAVTNPEGNTWRRDVGPEGDVRSETDPLGHTTQYETNPAGLLSRVTTPLGASTEWTYGHVNDLTSITSPLGPTWHFDFRANQQPNQVAAGDDAVVTSWDYGPLERLAAITDPNGNLWTRSHDPQGRLLTVSDPLGRAINFGVNTLARTQTLTFPGGLGTLTSEHNREWQLARQTYSDGTVLEYSYNANGDLESATGVTLSLDSLRRIATSNGIAIDRDFAGNITSVTYAPNRQVTYVYDKANRPTRVTDWTGGVTELAYDAEGKATRMQRPNGSVTSWVWDAEGRLIQTQETLGGSSLSDIQLTRDARGRIASAMRDVPMKATPQPIQMTWTYDVASQISSYDYDALGRVTQQGDRTYEWNLAGRLTRLSEPGRDVHFTYDALGQLLSRTEAGETRHWVWNYGLPIPVLAIERQNGNDTHYHVTLPGGALLYTVNAADQSRRFYHYDEMGNTLFRTNDVGAITERYAYTPYGDILSAEEASENRFAYQGQIGHLREGNNLVFMRARWYDTTTGRFLSRDPKNQSISPLETMPYSYARQNPLLFIDPRGTNVEVIAGGIHTDIKVDVWCGNRIIGTLTAGFFPKCVATNNPTASGGSAAISVGADSAIKGRFIYGNTVTKPSKTGNSSGNVFVRGFKPADERLAQQILTWMGHDPDGRTAAEVLKELYPLPKGTKSKSFRILVDSTDTFGGYRIYSQVCNDFTDEALDVYYGYNWYLGSFHFGQTLIDQVRDYEQLVSDGLPLGGALYFDLVPAIFGGG